MGFCKVAQVNGTFKPGIYQWVFGKVAYVSLGIKYVLIYTEGELVDIYIRIVHNTRFVNHLGININILDTFRKVRVLKRRIFTKERNIEFRNVRIVHNAVYFTVYRKVTLGLYTGKAAAVRRRNQRKEVFKRRFRSLKRQINVLPVFKQRHTTVKLKSHLINK
ncbi:MAG: DUF2129 domain-containing protein [Bacteroidia bacterium]